MHGVRGGRRYQGQTFSPLALVMLCVNARYCTTPGNKDTPIKPSEAVLSSGTVSASFYRQLCKTYEFSVVFLVNLV